MKKIVAIIVALVIIAGICVLGFTTLRPAHQAPTTAPAVTTEIQPEITVEATEEVPLDAPVETYGPPAPEDMTAVG